jgi:hypothetical protein
LTTFSRHKDWHSFEVSISQFSIMLHHKFLTRGKVITLFTIVSTGRRVTLSLSVCFLNSNSATSAMLTQSMSEVTKAYLLTRMQCIHLPLFPLALMTSRLAFLCFVGSRILSSFCFFDTMIWSHNQSNMTKVQIPWNPGKFALNV